MEFSYDKHGSLFGDVAITMFTRITHDTIYYGTTLSTVTRVKPSQPPQVTLTTIQPADVNPLLDFLRREAPSFVVVGASSCARFMNILAPHFNAVYIVVNSSGNQVLFDSASDAQAFCQAEGLKVTSIKV